MIQRIYLDHAATTPVLAEARTAIDEGLDHWANPSSPHADGRRARAAIEQARARIKAALGWSGELIFTSGATEAAGLALRDAGQLLISAVEHDSIRRQAAGADMIAVGPDGIVDPGEVPAGALVAIQHCNPETGVIQPIAELYERIRAAGAHLLVDAAQSAGKLPLPPADLIMVSAHKLGGPPGVGALLVRDLGLLQPLGGQEQGYRAGTENLPAILGFAAALEVGGEDQSANRRLLDERLTAEGATVICGTSPRSPYIAAYHMPEMSALAQLIRFDAMGFSISAGSACASGTTRPSHVLAALGLADSFADHVVRVSFGKFTPADDVLAFGEAWIALAREARSRAA